MNTITKRSMKFTSTIMVMVVVGEGEVVALRCIHLGDHHSVVDSWVDL